jgi:predicted DCC family thiol-disulfide oxidoreductase YuxK
VAGSDMLLYDGDCGFCSRTARWLIRTVPTRAQVLPWQVVDLTGLGVSADECRQAVQWVHADRPATPERSPAGSPGAAGPLAVAALLRTSTAVRWRLAGRVLGASPVARFAWPVYRLISRYRYRLPGGTPACQLPDFRGTGSD